MNVLTIDNISKSYGMKTLFQEVTFTVNDYDKIGIIGINGSGKSTLLKIIQGIEGPDQGQIKYMKGIRIESLHQVHDFDDDKTILDQALSDLSEYVKNQEVWDMESQVKTILTTLGIHDFNRKVKGLSGGQKKRIALATALVAPCDLLILDEPTNHMDNDTIEWLENFLSRRKGALLMITHDRYFLDRVVNKTIEIDRGFIYEYSGNYSEFIEKKLERMETEHKLEQKNENLFRKELAWIRRGARARSTKQKARIDRFEEIKANRGLVLPGEVAIDVASARLGNKTVELQHISKSFADLKVVDDFTYTLLKDDRIGIIGDNGKGKSTLLNIIAGSLKADTGRVEVGSTVRIGYFSQESEDMDEDLTAIEYIKETAENFTTPQGKYVSAAKMMETFLFDSELQNTYISKLSGGERRRLYLLNVLIDQPNVLLLDEPTNDLDIETLKVLERYIDFFKGIVLTVSHDRYFLDRTCDRIFAFGDQGAIKEYMGNYSDYLLEYKAEGGKRTLDATIQGQEVKTRKQGKVKMDQRPPKLTFNEKKEFQQLGDEIAAMEKRLDEIVEELALCVTDYTKLQDLQEENERVELELLEKMERLEFLQEKYDASQQG